MALMIMPSGENVFYANAVEITFVPTDAAIRFSFATPAARNEGREAAVVWIHMSPALAKVLARALSTAAARYEAEVGPLPDLVPESKDRGFRAEAEKGEMH
jgi:hypothetical protein